MATDGLVRRALLQWTVRVPTKTVCDLDFESPTRGVFTGARILVEWTQVFQDGKRVSNEALGRRMNQKPLIQRSHQRGKRSCSIWKRPARRM